MNNSEEILLLTLILRKRRTKRYKLSCNTFKTLIWVQDIFARREQHSDFNWLVQELKLGDCKFFLGNFLHHHPPQKYLHLVKTTFYFTYSKKWIYKISFLFFLINAFSLFTIFSQTEYKKNKKKHLLEIFSRRSAQKHLFFLNLKFQSILIKLINLYNW